MDLHLGQLALVDLCDDLERAFRPLAEEKGLASRSTATRRCRRRSSPTSSASKQILRNLLSNAVKFTHDGAVRLRDPPERPSGDGVLAFAVTDTGVGIPDEKLALIFEAFQQADGTTSRKYGAPVWA